MRFVSIGECMIEMSEGEDNLYRFGFAGDTLNTAWYARAALPKSWEVDYFTALGDDRYSAQLKAFLEANVIGTSLIREIPGKRCGLYLIHQEGGDRHFTYWRESSAARQLADDSSALEGAVRRSELIYFSGVTLAILALDARARLIKVLERARKRGAKIAFDPNIRPALWGDAREVRTALMQAAEISTFVLPTHADEKPYFGDRDAEATAMRYLDAGAEEAVVKNGGAPALIMRAGSSDRVPAEKVTQVLDPTGAGDSFNGAYLAARLTGKGMRDATLEAHRIAAIVIGHRGALVSPLFLGEPG